MASAGSVPITPPPRSSTITSGPKGHPASAIRLAQCSGKSFTPRLVQTTSRDTEKFAVRHCAPYHDSSASTRPTAMASEKQYLFYQSLGPVLGKARDLSDTNTGRSSQLELKDLVIARWLSAVEAQREFLIRVLCIPQTFERGGYDVLYMCTVSTWMRLNSS